MGIYSKIYHNICQRGCQLEEQWKPGSNIHRHHIIPKHMNGTDDISNFTYLTIREHIIAHFLLWKIYGKINDLRAMHMLGAKLTSEQRRLTGEWCRDNKIGFHNASKEERRKWQKRGIKTQKESGKENTFYWWSTKKGRKKRASMGGKASIVSPNNPWSYWASEEGRKKRASMGGKAMKGLICVSNGVHRTRIKSERLNEYLQKGYHRGFKLSSDT